MNGKRKGSRKWLRTKKRSGGAHKALRTVMAVVAIFAALFVGLVGAPASATPGDQVCTGLDSGKIDTTGDPLTVTVTAPEGMLIDGYCVKAGSVNQGDGPVYVTVDPPVKTLTFGYPGGKAVSHYSLSYTTVPPSDQCPDGSNPGDLNGDGEADEADCGYVPPSDQCPDGTNPGDVDGDGDSDAADCDYTPPPSDQCPDGTNPGDLNGDGVENEADCGYVPPLECLGDEVLFDDNDNGVVDSDECESTHYDPPPPFDQCPKAGIQPAGTDCSPTDTSDNPTFETGLGGQPQSEGGVPVGLLYVLLAGLFGGAVLIASPMLARARRRR